MASWLGIGVGVGVGLEAVVDLGVLGDEGREGELAVHQVVVLEHAHVRRVVLERDELALLLEELVVLGDVLLQDVVVSA